MDFFEALSKRAHNKVDVDEKRYGSPPFEFAVTGYGGIKATIEALKEMMVGEPQIGIVQHWGDRRTFINYTPRDFAYQCCTTLEGHQGTNGEEVMVMVFRIPKESE